MDILVKKINKKEEKKKTKNKKDKQNNNQDGETTEPKNLGDNINTAQDEVTPFYHPESKTLYFSSEGHIGFGGLDVFKTTINIITEWWDKPINVGKPINSERDDSYFVWG